MVSLVGTVVMFWNFDELLSLICRNPWGITWVFLWGVFVCGCLINQMAVIHRVEKNKSYQKGFQRGFKRGSQTID